MSLFEKTGNIEWTTPVPIWVSRKTADGYVTTFTVGFWLFLILGFVLLANVLLWSGIGLFVALKLILTAVF